jgi:hypothetical protein
MNVLKTSLQETLARMRKKLRTQEHDMEKKREEEAAAKAGEDGSEEEVAKPAPVYCKSCKVVFYQPRAEHDASEMHKLIKDFLTPTCEVCDSTYTSPMAYERHIASLSHLKVSNSVA